MQRLAEFCDTCGEDGTGEGGKLVLMEKAVLDGFGDDAGMRETTTACWSCAKRFGSDWHATRD